MNFFDKMPEPYKEAFLWGTSQALYRFYENPQNMKKFKTWKKKKTASASPEKVTDTVI